MRFWIGQFIGPWIMHVQILVFFLACRPGDPFRSEAELSKLLVAAEAAPSDVVDGAHVLGAQQ